MPQMMIDDLYPAMPWDEVDAVVFDVGNVLLSFSPVRLLQEIVPECPELHDVLLERVFRSPYWIMLDRGTISIEAAITAMSKGDAALAPYVRRVVKGWWNLPPIPEGVEALKTCKAQGKKLYVLSNYADEPFRHAQERYGFFGLFDGFIVSSQVHRVKPCRDIYDHLIASFGLTPARTLFIDDTPANIEAALEAGWQGLCFNRPGKLRDFLAK